MRSTTKKLLALGAAVTFGLPACGGADEVANPAVSGEVPPVEETTTTEATADAASDDSASDDAVDDVASALRADLTSLLQEHVYLTGIALETALDGGADDPATEAALDALDENTVALGEAVGSLPGVDDQDAFVELWREHIGYFVDYAVGRGEDDQEAVDQALADLEGYQEEAGDLFEQATDGELAADEVYGELQTHVESVTAAIDTLAGEGEEGADPFEQLRDAAGHMDGVALTIADAVTAASEDDAGGDPNSVPAQTRADLTSGLQEQVYLAVLAAEQLAEAGSADDSAAESAASALEGAAEDLANTVGGATGPSDRDAFLDAWRPHVEALLGYAEARTTGGDAGAESARSELDAAADEVSAALSELAGGADVSGLVDEHVETITTAIDSLAAGDAAAFGQARQAAQVMPELATALAGGIVALSDAADDGTEGGADTGDGTGVAPDEAAEGTTGAGTADGPSPGSEADQTGPGIQEEPEEPTDPSEDSGPEAEGDR